MNRTLLAIFDLDGTLLDTLDDLTDALNVMLSKIGRPPITSNVTLRNINSGMRVLVGNTLEQCGVTDADVDAEMEVFKQAYAECYLNRTYAYDGICELLSKLHADGIKTAVFSNKEDEYVGRLIEKKLPAGTVDFSLGKRDGIPAKPAPDGVLHILKTLGIPKENTIYIGDSDVDMKTAANAGLSPTGVSWGFRSVECLKNAGAAHIINKPSELYALIVK